MSDAEPDPLGVFLCGCCREHRPKIRIDGSDCIVCPVCDSPDLPNPPTPPTPPGAGAS